jgi:Coenzyme PQQ synthesis protein D (PqqD)
MLKIKPETLIQQRLGNIVSDMDGEKVMMSIQNGKYYNLGSIGGIIWDEIANSTSIEILVEKLTDKYDIEPTECMNQVICFIEKLQDEKLINISYEKQMK